MGKTVVSYTDGSILETRVYNSSNEAYCAMEKMYNERLSVSNIDIHNSYIYFLSARIVTTGGDTYLWRLCEVK